MTRYTRVAAYDDTARLYVRHRTRHWSKTHEQDARARHSSKTLCEANRESFRLEQQDALEQDVSNNYNSKMIATTATSHAELLLLLLEQHHTLRTSAATRVINEQQLQEHTPKKKDMCEKSHCRDTDTTTTTQTTHKHNRTRQKISTPIPTSTHTNMNTHYIHNTVHTTRNLHAGPPPRDAMRRGGPHL